MGRRTTVRSLLAWSVVVAAVAAGCGLGPEVRSQQVTKGDLAAGKAALEDHGCVSCHSIPGVAEGATAGPPLDRFGERAYIAGRLGNNQENLVRWIRDPKDVDPETAMPDLGVGEEDATNMAAYLLSLD